MSDQFSGTKDVADNLAFSLDNLNSYLESACPEVEKINSYKQFKGGHSLWFRIQQLLNHHKSQKIELLDPPL